MIPGVAWRGRRCHLYVKNRQDRELF